MVQNFLAHDFDRISSAGLATDLPSFDLTVLSSQHADAHLLVSQNDKITARCSLWWKTTPALAGQSIGYIGHYAAATAGDAASLLEEAKKWLREQGCVLAVGPMDGNTWRRYRLVTDAGKEPPFFLEPTNPTEWPDHFNNAGFTPLAEYYSALNRNLSYSDPRMARAEKRLKDEGIAIRSFRPNAFLDELKKIYAVSAISFTSNFLYTPLDEASFIAQYQAIEALIDPRFIFIAEHDGKPVGYIFAIPDHAQARRGHQVDTVILKTVAVLPGRASAGLGSVLVDKVHLTAHGLGFRQAIHALMHETNKSRNISGHYAQTIRRYTLFAHRLG